MSAERTRAAAVVQQCTHTGTYTYTPYPTSAAIPFPSPAIAQNIQTACIDCVADAVAQAVKERDARLRLYESEMQKAADQAKEDEAENERQAEEIARLRAALMDAQNTADNVRSAWDRERAQQTEHEQAAVAAERERCAKLVEDHGHSNGRIRAVHRHLAEALRAAGEGGSNG